MLQFDHLMKSICVFRGVIYHRRITMHSKLRETKVAEHLKCKKYATAALILLQ